MPNQRCDETPFSNDDYTEGFGLLGFGLPPNKYI